MTQHDLLASLETMIQDADQADCAALIGEMEKLKALAWGKMLQGEPLSIPLPDAARYLTVEEVAERFHVTPKWLYRHKMQMPHSQPSRKVLLFPEQAITKWFASRKGT
jgi:hypothetical protein